MIEVRPGSVWRNKVSKLRYTVLRVGANSRVYKRPVVYEGITTWMPGCRPFDTFIAEFEWIHD